MGRKHRKRRSNASSVAQRVPTLAENCTEGNRTGGFDAASGFEDNLGEESVRCPFCDQELPDAYAPRCKHCDAFSVIDRVDMSPLIDRIVANLRQTDRFVNFLNHMEEYFNADVAPGVYWVRLPKQAEAADETLRIDGPEYAATAFPLPVYRLTGDEEGYHMAKDALGRRLPDCRYCLHAARLRDQGMTMDGTDYCVRPLDGEAFASHFPEDYGYETGYRDAMDRLAGMLTAAWLDTWLGNVEDDPQLRVRVGEHDYVSPVCKAWQPNPAQDDFLDKIYEPTGEIVLVEPVPETEEDNGFSGD